jgi:hypothetical protein
MMAQSLDQVAGGKISRLMLLMTNRQPESAERRLRRLPAAPEMQDGGNGWHAGHRPGDYPGQAGTATAPVRCPVAGR